MGERITSAGNGQLPGLEDVDGARLLVSDARVAFLLIDEARYRVIERLFGVPREGSWLVTLVALALLAEGAHDRFQKLIGGVGGPTRADAAVGAGVVREMAYGIAGPSSRHLPGFGALVAISVTGHVLRPALAGSLRSIRASSSRLRGGFKHRYGHHLEPPRGR